MRADIVYLHFFCIVLLNFEKALISGSEKAIRKASSKLNSDFEEEYGDIQDLIADEGQVND